MKRLFIVGVSLAALAGAMALGFALPAPADPISHAHASVVEAGAAGAYHAH